MQKKFHQYHLSAELAKKYSHSTYLASPTNEPEHQVVLIVFTSSLFSFPHEREDLLQNAKHIKELQYPYFVPISLSSYVNNEGIGSAPGQANLEGSGYAYPADQLPQAGQRTLNGVSYLFPGSAPGANDNVVALGQTIKLPQGYYQQAFLLVAASDGSASGMVIVHYTDGSTSSASPAASATSSRPCPGSASAPRSSP